MCFKLQDELRRQERGHHHLLSLQRGEREERTIQIAHREGGYLPSEMPPPKCLLPSLGSTVSSSTLSTPSPQLALLAMPPDAPQNSSSVDLLRQVLL